MRRIGDLFEIAAGQMMTAASRGSGVATPFLRTSNVLWDEVDVSDVDEMVISDSALAKKTLRAGDLLVCEGGEIGRAAVWNGERDVMSFQNHVHRLRPRVDELESRFYVYFLQSAFTQMGIFAGAGNKTTIPNLSRGRLAQLKVPVPPIDEARALVAVLAHVRSTQRQNERSLHLAVELKQATTQALFTRGLRGEAQRLSEVGPIPANWGLGRLGSLCEISSGGTPPKRTPEYWSGDIPWVSGKDLKLPVLDDAIDHVTEAGIAAGSRLAPAGAVLLLVRGMGLAKDLPVAVISRPMAFNQDVKALVPRSLLGGNYIRAAVYAGKERLLGRIVPSAHGTMTLNLDDVASMLIPIPPLEEAIEMVRILDALEARIAIYRRRRAVLDELFKSVLLKLMTGEIRVADLSLDALDELPTTTGTPS